MELKGSSTRMHQLILELFYYKHKRAKAKRAIDAVSKYSSYLSVGGPKIDRCVQVTDENTIVMGHQPGFPRHISVEQYQREQEK